MAEKKRKLTLFEKASLDNQKFAINMYTFYLFQKSCSDLLVTDKIIQKGLEISEEEKDIERLMKEAEKNAKAWGMILDVEMLSGTSLYGEA